ncbi:DUF3786 domain-containing protein [Chloroflexota bacterium]
MPTQKTKEYGLELAFRLGREELAKIDDIEQQCRKSGALYSDSPKTITIEYLSQPYTINLPDIDVTTTTGEEEVPLRDKILILHYFTQAKGTPLSNNLVTYKELKEGVNYFPVFSQRAIKPLVTFFGSEPHRLLEIASILGGHKADYGDVAVTINAFSRVPITLALWKGDEELAPEGNIMFDSTIPDYLTNDDIHVLCETIAWRLVRLLKAGGDNPGRN